MTDFIAEVEQRITAHTPDVSMVDMDNLSVVEYTNAVMCLWEYAFDSMNSMTAEQSDFGRSLSEYKSHNGIRATRELCSIHRSGAGCLRPVTMRGKGFTTMVLSVAHWTNLCRSWRRTALMRATVSP